MSYEEINEKRWKTLFFHFRNNEYIDTCPECGKLGIDINEFDNSVTFFCPECKACRYYENAS